LVTPKEARKYLGRMVEVRALVFGFVLGIIASAFAQILMLPLRIEVIGNMIELRYVETTIASFAKDNPWLYIGLFSIMVIIPLAILNYGCKRIYGIPLEIKSIFPHAVEHKKALDDILVGEFEKLVKPYGYIVSSQIAEKDFKIPFKVEGRERLWVFVRDSIIELKCDFQEKILDLADEVEIIIKKTTENSYIVNSIFQELLERNVDEGGFRTYVSALNLGTTKDQLREIIRQSTDYKKQAPKRLKNQYSHLSLIYFTPGASPINRFGHRIVVNKQQGKAYHVTGELEDLARDGFIDWIAYPGENYRDWTRKQNLELFERPPTKEELSA